MCFKTVVTGTVIQPVGSNYLIIIQKLKICCWGHPKILLQSVLNQTNRQDFFRICTATSGKTIYDRKLNLAATDQNDPWWYQDSCKYVDHDLLRGASLK